ncbi:hypothetical protein G9A89_012599 [Geosiphon pyriformis]|nr:hypothetical protein G9A89_012599 [Geosiphon pyriformis]
MEKLQETTKLIKRERISGTNTNLIFQYGTEINFEEKDDGGDEELVWYLGYGSNMSSNTFTGRRKVYPSLSFPCFVPSYFLSFDIGGQKYMEPCFANIMRFEPPPTGITREYAEKVHSHCATGTPFIWNEKNPQASLPPTLQGVIHRIKLSEYRQILFTEPPFGWADIKTGYKEIEVECVTYDNEVILAKTLISFPGQERPGSQASERYLNILRDGAKEHHMDPEYRLYLSRLQPFFPRTLRKRIGKTLFMLLFFPVLYFLYSISMSWMNKRKQIPRWVALSFSNVRKFSTHVHDSFFKPVFGSGESNLDEQGEDEEQTLDYEVFDKIDNVNYIIEEKAEGRRVFS